MSKYVFQAGNYKLDISMHDIHDILIACHPCFQKTYMAIRCHYYWPNIEIDIWEYSDRCLWCQGCRVEQIRNHELLQSLEVPNSKSKSISMDFIMSLPKTKNGYNNIFVIVDCLTNIAHFIQ